MTTATSGVPPIPITSAIDNRLSGSISMLHSSGLNVTLSGGRASAHTAGRDDPATWYTKFGYQAKWFWLGPTSFSVDAGQTFDRAVNRDVATRLGVQASQLLTEWGSEFYAGITRLSLDRKGASFDDSLLGITGARVQF